MIKMVGYDDTTFRQEVLKAKKHSELNVDLAG